MKKILLSTVALALLLGISVNAEENSYDALYDKYQAVYTPSSGTWSAGGMADDRVVLTKQASHGSGSYSDYYYPDGTKAASLNSNFEFIKDGKLISVDNAKLIYSKVVRTEDGSFAEVRLTDEELQSIFPDTQIVKISEFKNGKITVKAQKHKTKHILLLNDTSEYFYKYFTKPKTVQNKDIKGFLTFTEKGKYTFAHIGDNAGKLVIKVVY